MDLLPASEFLPPDGWEAAVASVGGQLTEQLREDAARLTEGDVAEAAETWAALLTAGPAADHVPADAHLVVTDADELVALAGDLDRRRPIGAMASSRPASCPTSWPLPYEAAPVVEALLARADERLEEQAEAEAGYATAPALPGRAERAGGWLTELAAGGRSVVVTTDQASRVGELLEEAGRPTAPVAELREPLTSGRIGLVHGSLSGGFSHPASGLRGADRSRAVRRDPGATADERRSASSRATSSASSSPATTSCTSTTASRATSA